MDYRTLGTSDLKVSVICLGTMTWGKQNNEADGHAQMDYALERGVNFWDTAEMYAVPPSRDTYGATETIIGTWLAQRKKRDQVILATKVAGPGLAWIRESGYQIDKKNILAAIEGSLARLQTDYIDLYQLHWPNRGSYHFRQNWRYAPQFNRNAVLDNMLEVLHTLQNLIAAGKIRHVGLSNETAWGTMHYLHLAQQHNLPRMQSIQNEYSLLYRVGEQDVHEIAQAEQCGLLAWSPLATGMLSGKYRGGARPVGSRWTVLSDPPRDVPQAHKAVDAYYDIATRHGLDLAQMALAFVHQQPFVTSTIIGATTMEQLRSNIDSINVTLSSACLEDIMRVYKEYPIPF
ncbi:MAG: aldo/keto reductase [Alphaproteobacteria bacterium]|nr:MAG: aldo/keto reductase [Alphaproteobacteria bacterium]